MNLQDAFYTLGIVFMSINILILIAIVILLFYIKKKVGHIHRNIEEKMEDINNLAIRPVKKIINMAGSLVKKRRSSK